MTNAFMRTHGTLIGRIFLGLLFLVSGTSMFLSMGVSGVAGMVSSVGVPAAGVVAVIILLVKILGGLGLILGYKTDLAAKALFVFTLLTVLFVHNNMAELMNALKNLSVMGGLLYVIAYGPGDGWRLNKTAAPTM